MGTVTALARRLSRHACARTPAAPPPRAPTELSRVLVCGRAPNSGDSYALWRVMGTGARRGQRTALVRGEAGRRKTDKVGSKVLRALWAEQLRKRGYIVPTRVPALALLRPRGCTYPVDPGTVLGDGQQLAIDVCAAVERHVFSLFVFGNDGVECDPSDSVIRSGAVVKAQVHRDCPSLRRNTANLQFVAVLQGSVDFRIETTVDTLLPPRTLVRSRKKAIALTANQVLVFSGSRYAHSVAASSNCVRVTGWVCRAGHRVADDGGGVPAVLVGGGAWL